MGNASESRARCYADYGLNKNRNFMGASINEFGEKNRVVANTQSELNSFMYGVLRNTEIDQCAIFAHAYDGRMYALVKETDNSCGSEELAGVGFWDYMSGTTDMEFFAYLDARYELSCYAVYVQDADGIWTLLED